MPYSQILQRHFLNGDSLLSGDPSSGQVDIRLVSTLVNATQTHLYLGLLVVDDLALLLAGICSWQ